MEMFKNRYVVLGYNVPAGKYRRYRVIDRNCLEIIDDANGWGYKSIESAIKGFRSKFKKEAVTD